MVKLQPSKLATRVRFPLPALFFIQHNTQTPMKNATLPHLAVTALLALASTSALAEAPPPCDKIAADVREAVAKEPSKVLLIVEDALVINESCACEIVTTAIVASSADASLAQQIVETAVAVAPKMTAVIQDCAANALGAQPAVTSSGKQGVGKQGAGPVESGKEPAFSVQPPREEASVDYGHGGRVDIRGVYLTLPAAGGFIVTDEEVDERERDGKVIVRREIIRERKVVVVPVSPTAPKPGDPKPGDPKH
jgi:hypothetical protein